MEPVLNLTVQITATPNLARSTLDMHVHAGLGGIPELEDAFEDITEVATPVFTELGEKIGQILKRHAAKAGRG